MLLIDIGKTGNGCEPTQLGNTKVSVSKVLKEDEGIKNHNGARRRNKINVG